ncbi:hypothetical protein IJO12_07900 [bacterium]|nr:hypothetical protein [bacterium]
MLFNGVQTFGNYNPFMSCGSGFTNSIFPYTTGCCNYGTSGTGNQKPWSAGKILLTALGVGAVGVGIYTGMSWVNTKIQSKRTEEYNNANLSNKIASIKEQMDAKKEIFDKYNNAKDIIDETKEAHGKYQAAKEALPDAEANLGTLETEYKKYTSSDFPGNGIPIGGVMYKTLAELETAIKNAKKDVDDLKKTIKDNKEDYEKYEKASNETTEKKETAAKAAEAEYNKLKEQFTVLTGKQEAQKADARSELLDEADGNVFNRNTFSINDGDKIQANGKDVKFSTDNIATKRDLRGLINLYSHADKTQRETIYKKYQEAITSNSKLNKGYFANVLKLMQTECESQ